jgi:predicted molibdopterin-dependent oxidoreductase YjgC
VDGEPRVAYLGESVAAALMCDDDLELRSTSTGAARGVFCGMGVCFDCLVIVDGVPGARACITWVADGMVVDRQRGAGYPYRDNNSGDTSAGDRPG